MKMQSLGKLTNNINGSIKSKQFIFILSFIFFSAGFGFGQSRSDISYIKKTIALDQPPDYFKNGHGNNEYEMFFSGLFIFYKSFFSSQDIPGACSFSPSCSEYGLLSIKQKGIFFGILNTFDRLTRCNGMSPYQYAVDDHSGKYLDNP